MEAEKLVKYLAWKYSRGNKVLQKDLEQVGQEAIIKAREQFNPEKGTQFSTYAYHKIRGYILNYLRKLKKELKASLDSEITKTDDEDKLTPITEQAASKETSLSEEEKLLLEDLINILNEREKRIIAFRFGLFGEKPHLLGEIAALEKCSTNRIEQILKRSVAKMKNHLKKGGAP
jgi:RNA polymerase sporulation-specific sigma factor